MADGQRAQNAQKALQLEKEREIMNQIFREQRDKIRKDNKISISTDKFVRESDDLNKKLAKDTIGLVHLNQFQKIREDIEREEQEGGEKRKDLEEVERERKKRTQRAASRLSFYDEEEAEELEDSTESQKETITSFKKNRLGADPTVKSYFEASDFEAETTAALESSRQRQDKQQRVIHDKKKTSMIRLTLSFYDGADHRFCIDFKRGDTLLEVLKKCRLEYGPLRGVLAEDLMLIKENLILPTNLSVFDLEEMGALKDGGKGPYHNSSLFSFTLQPKDHQSSEAGIPVEQEDLIDTDASRNAKICSISWFERNKHLVPAKYWYPFEASKHCRHI